MTLVADLSRAKCQHRFATDTNECDSSGQLPSGGWKSSVMGRMMPPFSRDSRGGNGSGFSVGVLFVAHHGGVDGWRIGSGHDAVHAPNVASADEPRGWLDEQRITHQLKNQSHCRLASPAKREASSGPTRSISSHRSEVARTSRIHWCLWRIVAGTSLG